MNERIDVLAVPGHSSAEVAAWTAQQAIAFMAAEMKTYRPDIEAKCREASGAVAELFKYANSARIVLANVKTMNDRDIQMAHTGLATALARVGGAA